MEVMHSIIPIKADSILEVEKYIAVFHAQKKLAAKRIKADYVVSKPFIRSSSVCSIGTWILTNHEQSIAHVFLLTYEGGTQ